MTIACKTTSLLRTVPATASMLLFTLLSINAVAQSLSSTALVSSGPSDTSLQRRPLDIESSQPDPKEQYLLGAGDEITVSVAGRPELSGAHVVGPDGRITLPVVGSVDIGERSRDDAAKNIDVALARDYNGTLTSVVQVTKYGSNHILILGAVEHPGVVSFDQPPSLFEAITHAGSLVNADHSAQVPKKCVVYRGDDKVMNVNISDRLATGRALNDVRLRRNDVVYFPENQESLVSVLGEVMRPGPVRLTQTSTVVALLSSAGSITEKAGNNPEIAIVQPSSGKVQKVRYKDLLDPHRGSDITLHDGDIIFVPRSGLAKTGFFFQQVSPIMTIGTLVALIAQ